MRIAVTDVETTGLDEITNEIIEIGLVVFDDSSFEILDTLDIKVKPIHPETAHPLALQINGYTEEAWKDAVSLEEAIKIYAEKAKGATFCAHNMVLDSNFIVRALERYGFTEHFDKHKIDIFSLAWAKIPHDRMEKWSLRSICEYLHIPPEPTPHRGINGAMAEYEVYKKLMQ